MKTRIVKWDNLNGHRSFKMAVTKNHIGNQWCEPIGWKPCTEWERGLVSAVKSGCYVDIDGFGFDLADSH
jgi:hypothetical protein